MILSNLCLFSCIGNSACDGNSVRISVPNFSAFFLASAIYLLCFSSNLNRGLLWIYGEKVKADDWGTIDNLRSYWQKYGREVMGDNPIAWNAMKERRKEEKHRRAIAKAKKQAEKLGTEILTELP